ncbi:hypothetical protein OG851_33880 [Streptomyces sp. NBC_00161]|uniref:hypothetical protein n=1 Tax=Streptomyces sp. NBC_00161 TaxID=2975671 RepID=UPI00324CD838
MPSGAKRRPPPNQQRLHSSDRDTLARNDAHISFGQGRHGGWSFGKETHTHRGIALPSAVGSSQAVL